MNQNSPKYMSLVADHTAWCGDDFKAGVNLAIILNEIGNGKMIHTVNHIITKYSMRLKALSSLKSINVNNAVDDNYFFQLLFNDAKIIVKRNEFPKNVETHLLSLLRGKFKNAIAKVK